MQEIRKFCLTSAGKCIFDKFRLSIILLIMDKAYRAVSSAIYGPDKDSLVMSVSVVASRARQDIRLEYTDKQPIDTGSTASVRERFDWLHKTIVDTTRQQISVDKRLSTPVVFGVPEDFAGLDITDTLRNAYRDVLKPKASPLGQRHARDRQRKLKERERNDGKPQISEKLQRFLTGNAGLFDSNARGKSAKKSSEDTRDVWDLDKQLIEELMRKSLARAGGLGRDRMSFHPRLFKPLEHGIIDGIKSGAKPEITEALVNTEGGSQLEQWRAKAEAGEAMAHQMLRMYAIARAENAMMGYLSRIPLQSASSRFILIAPPISPFKTSPEYNFIQWLDLREIFGARVIELMSCNHPICIKAPGDTPSPAFADVAATYAYQLQVFAETGSQVSPAVVMIRHDTPTSSANRPSVDT